MLRPAALVTKEAPVSWVSWTFTAKNIPQERHIPRTAWESLLLWIRDKRPEGETAASDIQRWFLVTGLAIRDIHAANSVEPNEPIPNGGPEYLRHSGAVFEDLVKIIGPTLAGAARAMPDAQQLLKAASVVRSRRRPSSPDSEPNDEEDIESALVGGHPVTNATLLMICLRSRRRTLL